MVRTGTREHGTVSRELGTRLWPVEGRAVGDSFCCAECLQEFMRIFATLEMDSR
jgi:hypothetical protein